MSWWTLGKHFLLPAGCGNSFSAKTCRGAWGSGCWLVRGHVNMAEAKLCTQFVLFWSLGCTACGQALPWRRIGPLLFTSAGCRHCSFRCISLICWAYILDVMVSPGFRKLWWTRLAADHGAVTMICFWCRFGFGKWFGASSQCNYWASHCPLSCTTHCLLHVTMCSRNGSLLLHRIR